MGTPPPTGRFSSSEGHSFSSVDLNKKRKLQDESGRPDMSSPKQRFRVGTAMFGQSLVIRGGFLEEPIVREIHNELDQPEESERDSNSFMGVYDNSISSDAKDLDVNSITLTIHQNETSTSLNSYSNEALRTHLYSLESKCMKEMSTDLEDTLQFDPGCKVMEDMDSGFGSVHPIAELEDEDDAETETMILYSNDVAPNPYILSSGRWNLGEGSPLVSASKLTIDQEFEQYFSSLLL